jgi:Ricin-type beta-trefoil lectin domain/Spherulation-specific family 4
MKSLMRAVTAGTATVSMAALGCVVVSVAGAGPANASVLSTAAHNHGSHLAKASRLHLLLAHDSPDALPGTGTHPLSIVTLYTQPTDTQWTTVDDSAADVAGAIVNICIETTINSQEVNVGPGCDNIDWPSKNAAWDPTVSALQTAGITPLIYVTTDNGADSVATLETELSQAKSWWGITTPMFDQMTGTEGTADNGSDICTDGGADITCQSYYEQLYNYAMSNGAQAVMFNPGTFFDITPAFMYGPYEILQGFEGAETALTGNANPAPSWADSYGQFQFSATIANDATTAQSELPGDISDAMTDQHAGLIYENDESEPPNYSALPSWFSAFLTDLTAASLSDPTALYVVQASQKSGYCLDNRNGSTANGNHIQVWLCSGNGNQRWEYVPQLNGVSGDHQLQVLNGKCLDDPNDSKVNGTKVQLWACLGNPNQEWTAHTVNGSYVEYVNANGLCLDNTGNAKKDGNRVQVWKCNGDAAQQWYGPSATS